ncbi:MAG: fructose-1,6-bisphosphatase class 3 [Phycisphaerae bacterium]|jgi:fructose-1,6-bisphosphatase-3|nr:MAG: fructose-1,6-bisphosphatase class 3 [Phycisphaerae bacterium]
MGGMNYWMVDPDVELNILRVLAERFPTAESAAAEIARLSAVLTLPKGTIHVISDIHGEDKKLRHVINNASGTLRPVVEKLFKDRMTPKELGEFLTLTFYPAEVTEKLEKTLTNRAELRSFAVRTLRSQLELARLLASRYSLRRAMQVVPKAYNELLSEMLHSQTTDRKDSFIESIVDSLIEGGRVLQIIHVVGRLIRNLAVYELIIGGDCWDRGPRGDNVVDYLRAQPNVSFIWGNHDISWLGAHLGNEALICNVLRISLRYRRLTQIDEGYSIPLMPLEYLANTVYKDDPALHFFPRQKGTRPIELVARMQKAIAIMQFKLEGQMIDRNPAWGLSHRKLLHTIDLEKGTVIVDGKVYPLRDTRFPTLDPKNPYELSPEEKECIRRLKHSFMVSQKLTEHMAYLIRNSHMYLRRDDHLIFHGCVCTDLEGFFLPMPINGQELRGKMLFDEIQRTIVRAHAERQQRDLDLLWYLWSGPRSPLFGKDRIATFERDFIEDERPHYEEKDPYFKLIHEEWFCEKVLTEFGVDPKRGLIVNGHVPVKIEKGESPIKKSAKAITIDGAFSEAYGDHGYTLVLESDKTLLAKHHHFESVESAIRDGVDIIPQVTVVRQEKYPRTMADTERGHEIKGEIRMLQHLIEAYRNNIIRERV